VKKYGVDVHDDGYADATDLDDGDDDGDVD
jgi:hypothetical protein